MQHDEVIWQLINQHHCSFKAKTKTQNFCRNEYNVTGLCNRSSCPLANSRYATIREIDGILYLYMKSIERSHTPNALWERVKLPRNYAQALELIDKHLEHSPKFLIHKNKQRLTKMTQYLIRMRKLATRVRPKLITVPARKEKQETRKEAKAEIAAHLDLAIEKELLQRLQSGTYGDIYNFPTKEYERVLAMEEMEATADEDEMAADVEQEVEEEEEYEREEEPEVEYVEDFDVDEEDDIEDFGQPPAGYSHDSGDEDDEEDEEEEGQGKRRDPIAGKRRPLDIIQSKKPKRVRPRVEVEYEEEHEEERERQS